MMEQTKQTQIFRQISDFHKNAMDTSYKSMEMMQERMDKMTNLFLEQMLWASEKWGTAITDWNRMYQDGYENISRTTLEKISDMGFPCK